jgi:hypothetical protein
LHSLDSDTGTSLNLDLTVAAVNVRVEAPSTIISVLERTLQNVPRFARSISPEVTFYVAPKGEMWQIDAFDGTRKALSLQSALPQVSGAIISSIVGKVAASRDCIALRAAVVEKNGRALAMIGDDWETAILLAAHLHGRGWSYLGGDNVIYESASRRVSSFEKSLYVNSSAVSQLPLSYRRAVEGSPWYVTAQGISFYAVDPTAAGSGGAWSTSATLCGILLVDGAVADVPSLETLSANQLEDRRFAQLGLDEAHMRAADLRIGGLVDTCDLVECWFESIPT